MKVGVLASGSGTNLQVLLDDEGIDVAAVASDKPDAQALQRAAGSRVPSAVFARGDFDDRAARDLAMADWLQGVGVELVVLAGYMQLLTPGFLSRFPERVVNVHPSLLPAFPGLDAIGDALAYGVKVAGVTVHQVDEGIDTGPILLQAAIDVPPGIDRDGLHDLLRPLEHRLLPEAVRLLAG
ncbi:MAG: phosphoribosylglycinamide formyltransferase [Solirubrobacteraceae bacterium]